MFTIGAFINSLILLLVFLCVNSQSHFRALNLLDSSMGDRHLVNGERWLTLGMEIRHEPQAQGSSQVPSGQGAGGY